MIMAQNPKSDISTSWTGESRWPRNSFTTGRPPTLPHSSARNRFRARGGSCRKMPKTWFDLAHFLRCGLPISETTADTAKLSIGQMCATSGAGAETKFRLRGVRGSGDTSRCVPPKTPKIADLAVFWRALTGELRLIPG